MKRKNYGLRRILSIVMTLLLLMGTVSVSVMAEDAEIAVVSHANGDMIESGKNVTLNADWNISDVTRVDFYANGNKLPGFITNPDDGFVWQTPAAGSYDITAVASCVSGAEVKSEPVQVYVKPEGFISGFYDNSDLYGWAKNTTGFENYEILPVNGALAPNTVEVLTNIRFFLNYNTPFICSNSKYINLLMYVSGIPEASDGVNSNVTMRVFYYDTAKGKEVNIATVATIKNGWSTVSADVSSLNGIEITKIDVFYNNTATDMPGADWKNVYLNINGLYYSDELYADSALTAEPVIPDGRENVCNGLKTYRINLSRPTAYNLSAEAVANGIEIVNSLGTTVEGITTAVGTDYVDVKIPESSLAHAETYTVSVAENTVYDCFGTAYAGGSFSFTTIGNGCTAADPIPAITFPKNGSTVKADSTVSAKVIFSDNVKSVEFVTADDVAVAGEIVTGKSGEYTLIPNDGQFGEGEHTLRAKVTTTAETDNVFYSEAVTFTTAETDYKLVGIENGDIIFINENMGKTVSVIDNNSDTFTVVNGKGYQTSGFASGSVSCNAPDAAATLVDKVEYYLNGELASVAIDAPYSAELDIDTIGANSLVAKVYDVMGGVTEFERSFDAVYGYAANGYEEDFEGESPVLPETMISKYPDLVSSSEEASWQREQKVTSFNGSNAFYVYSGRGYIYIEGDSNVYTAVSMLPGELDLTNDTNRMFIEFDYSAEHYSGNSMATLALQNAFKISKGQNGDYGAIKLPTALLKGPSKNNFKTTRLGFDISWDNNSDEISWKVYLNGQEYYRQTTNILYRDAVNPEKLVPVLSCTGIQLPWYFDNISVRTYNVADSGVSGVESQQREFSESGTAGITVANTSADAVEIVNYIAVYNSASDLASVSMDEITLNPGKVSDKTYEITLADGQTAKVLTWYKGSNKPVTLR